MYNDPVTYEDAMTGDNSGDWKAAMNDEMLSLNKNETWILVDLPQNNKNLSIVVGYTRLNTKRTEMSIGTKQG